jgi:hypothetical protein
VASELYKEHLLVSRAQYDSESECWVPAVIISWKLDGKFQFHSFNHLSKTYKSAQEAVSQGFLLAKLWVDKKL